MKANQNKLKVNQNEMNEKKREKEILLILLAYVRKFLYLCTLFKKQDENCFKSTTITTFIFQQQFRSHQHPRAAQEKTKNVNWYINLLGK
jgi:hypothetical protein